jgi:hypothetical protein
MRTASHYEWLLDEAIDETFPASDPVSPYYVERRRALPATVRMRLPRTGKRTGGIVAAALVFLAGYALGRRRG